MSENVQSDKFNLNVNLMSEEQIKNINQSFTKIDLRMYMNRALRDEVAGDGTGGWSDQGDNDMRMFDKFGNQEMLGVPFNFVDPEKNGGKGVVAIRGRNDMELPTSVSVPINRTAAGAYIVHASPWCSGTCGTYTWEYEDGSRRSIDIVQNVHMCDFWGEKNFDYVRAAWTATKEDGSLRSLYLFAMNNPEPEKKIKNLIFETSGSGPYIMLMAVTLTDKGPFLTSTDNAEKATMSTFGWFEKTERDENAVSGTALDFSYYLDAPAGKHGRLKANGDSLVFEDGTKARFWGADVTGAAAMPDRETAEKAALRLSHMGVNLVRFAEFDGEITDGKTDGMVSKEKTDRLAYFIAKLKEKGIYTYISFTSPGGLEKSSCGLDIYFDDELANIQGKYINAIMGFENPYTGMKLKNDPSVCFAELLDGVSVFDYGTGMGKNAFATENGYETARKQFNEFLNAKYGSTARLAAAWNSVYDRSENETVEDMSVELKANLDNTLVSDNYKKDVNAFLEDAFNRYYMKMREVLDGSCAISTVNTNGVNSASLRDTAANANTDFVSRVFRNAKQDSVSEIFSSDSIYSSFDPIAKTRNNIIRDFTVNAPSGKPYVACWAAAMPNLYFSEVPVMMAAFSARNGWNAVQHSFAVGNFDSENLITDYYSIYNNPVRTAVTSAAAALYYSADSEGATEMKINKDIRVTEGAESSAVSSAEIFKKNMRSVFTEGDGVKMSERPKSVIKTNDMYWDTDIGFFAVTNDFAEAITGKLNGRRELEHFAVRTDNIAATVMFNALDKQPISGAKRYLVTAAFGNQNYAAGVNLERSGFTSLGQEPVVVEPITGTVTIKIKGDFSVYPLSESGERMAPITVVKDNSGFSSFEMKSEYKTLYYEIVKG